MIGVGVTCDNVEPNYSSDVSTTSVVLAAPVTEPRNTNTSDSLDDSKPNSVATAPSIAFNRGSLDTVEALQSSAQESEVSYALILELEESVTRQYAEITLYGESEHLLVYEDYPRMEETDSVPSEGFYCYQLDIDLAYGDYDVYSTYPGIDGVYIKDGKRFWIEYVYSADVGKLEDDDNMAVVVAELNEGEVSKWIHIGIPGRKDVSLHVTQERPRASKEIPAVSDLSGWTLYVKMYKEGQQQPEEYENESYWTMVYNIYGDFRSFISDDMTFRVEVEYELPILRQSTLCDEDEKWQ